MGARPVKPFRVPHDPAGRTADAIITSHLSPTGGWCAEWLPDREDAIALTDQDGDYIPAPARIGRPPIYRERPVRVNVLLQPADLARLEAYPGHSRGQKIVWLMDHQQPE